MRSIERRFKNIAEKNQNWSSYVCFAEAIKKQNFSKQTIHRWFYKLVEKDDYAKNERMALFAELCNLSKTAEDNKN